MSDLIDRSALIVEDFTDMFFDKIDAKVFEQILNCAPAVNAVEVVFCKNCKHRETTRCITPELVNDDDYCSYGKRRESEVNEC